MITYIHVHSQLQFFFSFSFRCCCIRLLPSVPLFPSTVCRITSLLLLFLCREKSVALTLSPAWIIVIFRCSCDCRYCGGVPAPADGPPSANSFLAGADAQVLFQQNLNHYWESNPGSLDVALSYDLNPTESSWQTLLAIDDFASNDMVTQTNFSATVRMPSKAADHALLRFRYVSHNTAEIDPANNTDSIFYNCADIRLIANPATKEATDEKAAQREIISQTKSTETGCSTPDEWQAWAVETTLRGSIAHNIVYDGTHQLVQWCT